MLARRATCLVLRGSQLVDGGHAQVPAAAGPVAVTETWGNLRTDSAWHTVLWVSEWPRSLVYPGFLAPVLLSFFLPHVPADERRALLMALFVLGVSMPLACSPKLGLLGYTSFLCFLVMLNLCVLAFVEHALCAKPRLLVLIMPATNYAPPGYKLIVHDDQLCRGHVFYNPGSISSQRINANSVAPLFLVYEREEGLPMFPRAFRCTHVCQQLARVKAHKRKRNLDEERHRMLSRRMERELTDAARAEDESHFLKWRRF